MGIILSIVFALFAIVEIHFFDKSYKRENIKDMIYYGIYAIISTILMVGSSLI